MSSPVPKCFPTKKNIGGMRKERTLLEMAGNETAVGCQGAKYGTGRSIPKRDTEKINAITASLVDGSVLLP